MVRSVLLPVVLVAGLGACANNGVQPGYVNTASGSSTATASSYGTPVPGESGRVVAINDVSLRGGSGGGSGNGPMVGGLLGGLGGIAIGASGGRGLAGGLIGGVLGAVAGGIGGVLFDRSGMGSGGRGIEVTVQKDNGQTVTVAQRDDGDVQLGDRVQIVQDRSGTAKAVRDNSRQPDYQNQQPTQTYTPAPQDYRQAGNTGGSYGSYGPPPQDYRQQPQDYGSGPQPTEYGQRPRYAPPQSTSRTGYPGGSSGGYYQTGGYQSGPQPQNDPRYGTLE
jgi:outer membrane lipoprotein SlyB